jgi:hypothetical protein
MPGESIAEHLARQLEVGLHHLGARDRALAPGGEPIRDAEQSHIDGHRLGRNEVVIDRAPRERALVDQETSRRWWRARPSSSALSLRLVRRRLQIAPVILAPTSSWPMKVT